MIVQSNIETVRLRAKWRPILDEYIARCQSKGVSQEIVLRDIERLDDEPNSLGLGKTFETGRKAALVGTKSNSAMLATDWSPWRPNPKALDHLKLTGAQKMNADHDGPGILVAYVRFEKIVEFMEFGGDDYTSLPNLFVHYNEKDGVPFYKLAFCRKWVTDEPRGLKWVSYSEICSLDAYRQACIEVGVPSS